MAFTTYDFDGGTDGDAIGAGAVGNDTAGGTPRYETAAAVHGALGVEMIGSGQFLRYVIGTTSSGSIYSKAPTSPSGSNRFLIFGTSSNGTCAQFRYHDSGTFSIVGPTGTQIGANSLTTWTTGDVFRFDWQWSETATGSGGLTVRIFKGANVEGTTADEQIAQSITYTGNATRIRVSCSTAGWTTRIDTLRLSPLLEWAEPFAVSGPTTFQYWNGSTWTTLTPSLWTGSAWIPLDIDYTPALPVTTYTYEGGVDGAVVAAGVDGVIISNNNPLYDADAAYHGTMGIRCTDTANYIYNAGGLTHSFSVYTRQVATSGVGSDRSITYLSASTEAIIGFRFSTAAGGRMGIITGAGTLLGTPSGCKWVLDEWFRIDGQLTRSFAGPDYTYTLAVRIFRYEPDSRVPIETLVRSTTSPYPLGQFRLGSTQVNCAADFDTLRITNEIRWLEPYAP